jgi:putative hydrolase of the HAD superfamily
MFKPLRNELFARFFGVKKSADEVTFVFRHFDLLFNRINERTEGNVHYTEMLYVILDHLGIAIDDVPESAMEAYYMEMEQLFFEHRPHLISAETADILKRITDNGCTINILSNTGFILGKTLRPLLEQLDVEQYFSFQLYSDEMGNSKPSQKVYETVFRETQKIKELSKNAVLHIGDNTFADVEGATRFGFRSALIDETNTLKKIFLN